MKKETRLRKINENQNNCSSTNKLAILGSEIQHPSLPSVKIKNKKVKYTSTHEEIKGDKNKLMEVTMKKIRTRITAITIKLVSESVIWLLLVSH